MSYIMVDVESDGPIPGDYSMISFGAVLVNESLDQTFHGQLLLSPKNSFPKRWLFPAIPGNKPSHLRTPKK